MLKIHAKTKKKKRKRSAIEEMIFSQGEIKYSKVTKHLVELKYDWNE